MVNSVWAAKIGCSPESATGLLNLFSKSAAGLQSNADYTEVKKKTRRGKDYFMFYVHLNSSHPVPDPRIS
jgi:hypothetical protein